MKSKFIAILTLSVLAFFATASAKSDVSSEKKSVKTEITKQTKTEIASENDFKKMREERREARKGFFHKIKAEKDEAKVTLPEIPAPELPAIDPAKDEIANAKTKEEIEAEHAARKAEMEAKKAEEEAKRAEREEAMKAEREARKAEIEAKKAEKETLKEEKTVAKTE